MTALDWLFVAVLLLSVVIGLWRGLVYEVLSLAGWVLAFVLAQWSAPGLAGWLPVGDTVQSVRYAIAFGLVFIVSVFAAGLLASLMRRMIQTVGLRPVDRMLGTGFGAMRGIVLVLAIAVVFLLTPLRDSAWWTQSQGAPVAVAALKGLKPMLPERFGRYLPG
ncbi:MAG: CvpA family protein [Pseudomonadota bacterium]